MFTHPVRQNTAVLGRRIMTVVCPRLNPFASNPIVITSLNQYELRLSSYDRVPGTKVTLSCVDDLEVQGQSIISCQEDGNWNFESRPFCAKPSLYGAPSVDDSVNSDLPESAKILIGVMVAVTLIVTIIMIFISCLIRRKMKELQKHQKLREEVSPLEDEDQRKRGLVFINNNPQSQPSLNDYNYTAVTGSDISVTDSRNDNSAAPHLSNSKRESTNHFSPKPIIKPVNNGQKGRRHSEVIQRKNINHDAQSPPSNSDSARVFQSVNAGLREDVKKQNSRRQRSLSAAGYESIASRNQSPNSENMNHLRGSKNNQTNNAASVFTISGRSSGSVHRGSISLGEEDEHHTDLTEINTDAMSYGRDPFLWKSVPHDWNSQ